MKNFFYILTAIVLNLLYFSHNSFSITIAGLNISENFIIEKETLCLNGTGLRRILGIKIYAGALYLKEKSNNPEQIINSNKPMAIKLIWLRRIPIQKMPRVWTDSFKLATNGNIAPIQDKIDKIIQFTKQEKIKKYVSFNFVYLPDKGLILFVDTPIRLNKKIGVVQGLDFKKTFFKIWLGDNPCQVNLKNKLLGLD